MTNNKQIPGYIYTPYVPLQTTNLNLSQGSKQQLNISLTSYTIPNHTYQIALAQKFKFIKRFKNFQNIAATFTSLYPSDEDYQKRIDDSITEFLPGNEIFISKIEQDQSKSWINTVPHDTNNDYIIHIILLNSNIEKQIHGPMLVRMLDSNVVEV